MIKAQYFYNLYTINQGAYEPFAKSSLIGYIMDWLDLTDEGDLAGYQLPSDLSTNDDIYDELISLVLSKYHSHANIKIEKSFYEGEPTNDEIKVVYSNNTLVVTSIKTGETLETIELELNAGFEFDDIQTGK